MIIGEPVTPSFIAIFFSKSSRKANFFWIRFKSVDSNYDYSILPELVFESIVQISLLEISQDTAVIIYRRLADYCSLYSRSLSLARLKPGVEKIIKSQVPLLSGSNGLLACKMVSSNNQIDCIMSVEGNKFAEFIILANEEKPAHDMEYDDLMALRKGHKVREFTLEVNSTKNYSHYLNSISERIDFSDKFIVLQVNFPVSSFFTKAKRFMMVFSRESSDVHLYRGIPCYDYSKSCERSVDLIVGDTGRDFCVAVEDDNNLVMNYTFKERRFVIPPKSNFGSVNISDYSVQISNVFDPDQNTEEVLSSVVNFLNDSNHIKDQFSWVGAILTFFPLWMLVAGAIIREYKAQKRSKNSNFEKNSDRATIRITRQEVNTEETEETKVFRTFNNISLMDRTKQREEIKKFEEDSDEEIEEEESLKPRPKASVDTPSDV